MQEGEKGRQGRKRNRKSETDKQREKRPGMLDLD